MPCTTAASLIGRTRMLIGRTPPPGAFAPGERVLLGLYSLQVCKLEGVRCPLSMCRSQCRCFISYNLGVGQNAFPVSFSPFQLQFTPPQPAYGAVLMREYGKCKACPCVCASRIGHPRCLCRSKSSRRTLLAYMADCPAAENRHQAYIVLSGGRQIEK
jgi:hypothetical protein